MTEHKLPERKPILSTVGLGLAPSANTINLTSIGEIAKEQLFILEDVPYIDLFESRGCF